MFIIQEKINGKWYDYEEPDGTPITYETKKEAEKDKKELEQIMTEFYGRFDKPNHLEYRVRELKPGYYMADTFYGIQPFGFEDFPKAEIMPCQDFYDELDTLSEGAEIFTYFDYEDLDLLYTIYKEYGIKGVS
jgi:hypothetical protein